MLSHAEPRAVPDAGGLGRRIATLRRGHGWSQRRLAEAAGVSHGYIALLELGRLPSPGKFRLDAVARALNLRTADALLGSPVAPVTEFDHDFDEVQPFGRASLPTAVRGAAGAGGIRNAAASAADGADDAGEAGEVGEAD